MSKPKVYFTMFGAAGNQVTGSCSALHIEYNHKTLNGLIDIGIFQGEEEYRNHNHPIDAAKLDFVIITHSHADHFLGLPFLRGFKGKVYGTASAFAQGKELLEDTVYTYERKAAGELGISYDAYRAMCNELETLKRRKATELDRYKELSEAMQEIRDYAIYTMEDVDAIEKQFFPVNVLQDFMIAEGIYMRLIPSTHQNGAVSIELYIGKNREDAVNISFSGDIGPIDSFLYKPYKYLTNPEINAAVMESLHGIEEREQYPEEAYHEIKNIILEGIKNDKTIILVGFALDRSAMLLRVVNCIIDEVGLSTDIYFDSPLAYKELQHYRSDYATDKKNWFKKMGNNPFGTDEIIVTNKYVEHMRTVRSKHPKIVITASAFGEGGRVIDYFKRYIQKEDAIFVFAGWMSPTCTSNILHTAEKGKIVEIHEDHYVKHCETYQISGFSAHGYYPEFVEYIDRFPNLNGLILNHAEREVKESLLEKLHENYQFEIHSPEMYDSDQRNFYLITSEGIKEIPVIEGYEIFSDILKK